MIVTTTATIDGQPIQEYLGVAAGEAIMGANVLKDILSKAPTAPEVERVVIELGYLYGETEDAEILSLLEAQTAAGKAFATVAREVLMNAHFRVENDEAGRAIAEGLIRDYPGTDHERNAWLSLFYANMSRTDLVEAQNVLAILETRYAEDQDVLGALWLAQIEGLEADGKAPDGDLSSDATLATGQGVETYPNPFNPAATIAYSLTSDARVQLKIYDVLGREVARLVDAPQSAGRHEVVFDGSSLPTGVYLYRLEAGSAVQSGSVILMK